MKIVSALTMTCWDFVLLSVLMGGATLLLKVFLKSRAPVSGNVLHSWLARVDLPAVSPVRC